MSTQAKRRYSVEEYLALEMSTETRHEFLSGEIFAMGGASFAHSLIKSNIAAELSSKLKAGPCKVTATDLRVKVSATDLYTYPDVTVVHRTPQLEPPGDTLLNPQVIIEVLSDSTEAYDRGKKFSHYQQLASLTDYVLVSQDKVNVEAFARQIDGGWLYRAETRLHASLPIVSLHCELPLAEIYDKVEGLAA